MVLFIEVEKSPTGKKILINWQEIISVLEEDNNQISVMMTNKDIIQINCSFKDFKKVLMAHELTLDENSRIIAPDTESGGWMMMD